MIVGTIYGVILNDRIQCMELARAFKETPYEAPPVAPVLYIKPRTCLATGDSPVLLPDDLDAVEIAATLAVSFGRDLTKVDDVAAHAAIAGACLAIDVSEPHGVYFRPAIRQRCRDTFLPLGRFAALPGDEALEIVTTIDGIVAHRWSLDRLVRPIAALAAELSAFMTLGADDLLLIGLPGDAPRAGVGASVAVSAAGLPLLSTRIEREPKP